MTKIDLIIKHPDGTTEELKDLPLPLIFGRAPDCDVVLNDASVSRYHFSIEEIENSIWVKDLDSRNGTFVNSERIKSRTLGSGDTIQAGGTIIKVKVKGEKDSSIRIDLLRELVDSKDLETSIKKIYKELENKMELASAFITFKGNEVALFLNWKASDEELKIGEAEFKKGKEVIKEDGTIMIPFKRNNENLGGLYFKFKKIDENKSDFITTFSSLLLLKLLYSDQEKELEKEITAKREITKFVPFGIVPEVVIDGISTEPDEKDVSILFCDIANFTSICEKITLKDVADLLERYFHMVSESVRKYSGWVNKFMGDGAMCIFGAPLPLGNHPLMAVKCGCELLERIKELRRYPYMELNLRIGINSGKCIVGKIGKGHYSEYTVIGDAVNVASRLQEITEPGTILIGETTYESIKGEINTRYIGTLSLKGKKLKTRMYQIIT